MFRKSIAICNRAQGRTRRCSRPRGHVAVLGLIAHRAPAAAELGRSAAKRAKRGTNYDDQPKGRPARRALRGRRTTVKHESYEGTCSCNGLAFILVGLPRANFRVPRSFRPRE